jgi:hypothetical protein
MAIKKTSGGDSPLWQGARKSSWTLPIFRSMAAADRDVFWKSDRVFRFFLSGGPYRRRGGVRGRPGGPHHQGVQASPRPRRPMVWPPSSSAPSPLQSSGSSVKYLDDWLLFRPILRIFPV